MTDRPAVKELLSTSEVARLMGVAVGSVANWIDQGVLKAGRTPGGHRRVTAEDLLDFLHRQELPIPPELAAAQCRILIVDDEPAVAKWLAAELQRRLPRCEVLQANDGFSAGEMLAACRPWAVVLDLRMPGMDGYEVCRRIKSRPETAGITVIAITADASQAASARIVECGAEVCLPKPVDIDKLVSLLKPALRGL